MDFDPHAYGSNVAAILALDGGGERLMPLASGVCSSSEAARLIGKAAPSELFPKAPHPDAAYAGLWLYFSCLDESHRVSQGITSREGSFWHAIMHRQEPDAGNSAYWFRRVGRHPVFEPLAKVARRIVEERPDCSFRPADPWDPFAYIRFCEDARRRRGSADEKAALEIQRAEWQLLFHHCAR
jgi:hypothetical protein